MSQTTLVARPWWLVHWLGIFIAAVACFPSTFGLLMGLTHPPFNIFSLAMNGAVAAVTGFFGFRWARLMARLDGEWLVLRGLLHTYRIRRGDIAAVVRFDELQLAPEAASTTVKRLALIDAQGEVLAVIPNSFDILRGGEEILNQLSSEAAGVVDIP